MLETGSYFGELSLLLGIRRSSSARAVTPCNVFVLNKEDIQNTVGTFPALAARMEQSLRDSLFKANRMRRESEGMPVDVSLDVSDDPAQVANRYVSLWRKPKASATSVLQRGKPQQQQQQQQEEGDGDVKMASLKEGKLLHAFCFFARST